MKDREVFQWFQTVGCVGKSQLERPLGDGRLKGIPCMLSDTKPVLNFEVGRDTYTWGLEGVISCKPGQETTTCGGPFQVYMK